MPGLGKSKPNSFLEVENCIFFFDPAKEYVFSSAVIMGSSYGFYGIKIGANWLETAGQLETQGFKQASDLERLEGQRLFCLRTLWSGPLAAAD